MKGKNLLKSTLCLLTALVCNVSWAQTSSWFKMGASTTSLSDGDYVLVAKSDKGTGPVFYDPNVEKPYRYDVSKTVAEGHAVQSKYVWTIDETTIDGVQHITVTNHDDNTKAFPVDGAKNLNFTGSGTAPLKTEMYTADGVGYIVLTLDDDAIGYVHANAPGGNPCLSYWPTNGDGASCIKFTFFPVDALTNEERLTYNVGDGKYNDRAGSSWRNGWTSTNVGKPSFTISVGANNVNAGSTEYIGLRPGNGGCTYTLTLGETFTGYSFEAKSNNANPAHVVTINGKETTISSTEWTTVRADVVGTTASFGLKGSNDQDLYIRNVKFEQNAEVLAAATANTNMNIFGLQRYLGLVQNAGTGLEGNGQLICNYPAPTSKESGNAYANLLDGTYTTFFHSGYDNYRGDGSSHYLQANLGKAVKSFRFYFKKRSQNDNNRPKEILIEGSVDGNTFEEIETISDGMPSGAAPTDYYSDGITASKAYKYLRFTVKKTHNDQNSGNPFFTFSEFYILPNTPKVAETFDAVRGFRAGATVENATKLNEVYAWHQGFTGDAYPNDLYEGVYTLTINGPAAATATYNGESKALPATFYVTEEVAEENAAVTIASTESTLSFNCFSDETDTYETLTVTSLTENKVYTANFNYSLELKESTGRFTDGSKVWSLTTNDANPVALTFTSNANNMNHNGGYIQLHSGQAKSSTYTLTVPEGYIILEYSFDYAFGNTGTGDKKFVVGGQDYPVKAESQPLSVKNVNATTTQFVLTGENQPVKVQNFIVKVKAPTTKEIADAKKTAKDGVDANAAKLQQDLGYYSYTIGGAKVYTIDAVKAAIDAAATIVEVNAITASFALNVPEVGKYYRIKGKTSGNYIDAVQCYSGDQMGMKSSITCNYLGTIFLLDEGNRLMNVGTGTYVKGTRHIGADKNGANTWTFNAGSVVGCLTLTANGTSSHQLHDNTNRADRCGSICDNGTHDFVLEEVKTITLTIDAPAIAGATATWNGETKALPATWGVLEGMAITNPELTLNCDNVNYTFGGLFEGEEPVEFPASIEELPADRSFTAKFTPAFFSASTDAGALVPVQIYNMRDKGYTICLNNAAAYTGNAVNSGTTEYSLNEIWYLVGDAESFKMYSHTAGMDLALTLAGTGRGSAATMTATGTELSLIVSGNAYCITPKANKEQSFNMYGNKGNDIKLYDASDDASSWGINVMDITHSLTYSVTVSGTPWDDRYGVGELTFNVNGISSSTHITGPVAAQTCYLPKNATFTLSSIPYRGYTFSVPGGAESYEGTLAEGNLTIDLAYTANEEKILYHTPDANGKPYRIPAIAAAPNGHIFAIADNRPCGKDIGYGEVDIKCRISKDNGATWGEEFFIADGQGGDTNEMTTGYGDAAVVADRESNKLLVMMVCGKTVCHDGRWDKSKIGDTDATAVNRVARIYLTYNEETGEWDKSEIVEMTDHIYSLFLNGETPTVTSMFIGSGKICQSRVVKKGDYYRLYCSMWTRDGGNRVIYSDDFGGTWNVLGTINDRPASGGDEPKVEELADGTVVLSSRKYNGRYFNLFTFSDNTYTTGTWGTAVASNEVANGLSFGGNSTNGEIYKVTVMHKESKRICDLMFQSVPTGSGRDNVAIFYKELDESTTYTPTTIAQGWTKGKHVSYKSSCYSTMIMQADGRIAFLFEEAPHEYCIVYIPYTIEDLTGGAYCYVKPIIKQDLYNTSKGDGVIPPYRIPGITTAYNGRLITAAARLVCGTDPGYGQVDVVCRYSDDHGDTWSEMIDVAVGNGVTSATVNYFETAFGDPAIVADRTSSEVLIIAVAGCTVYGNGNTTRQNPNMIATIHSTDNGETWGEPVNVTEPIYSLFDSGNPIQSAFVGGGKIFQSRIVKVGKYYRLYAAMCARPNGNRVIYSDDFGRTWHALGGASALPAPGGDEPKCEELPDGRVILSSRVGGGRIYNIYTYSNTETAEGSWGTDVKSTFEGSGLTPGGNSTNGEILIVPVKRNSDGKEMYLALQSLPTGSGRTNVGIFYKELTDMTDINTVANFAADWNGFFQVSNTSSAYSSMDLQADNRIGFIYEETLTGFGKRDNPVSTSFPNGEGQHNFDGFDNIYVAYPLEYITDGAYSIKRDVNRRTYVSDYFTALTAEASDEMKAKMATALDALSAEPTIAEVDKLNLIAAVAQEAEGTWYCFRFEEKRTTGGNVVPVNSWGYIGDNLKATATPAKNGSYFWQKIDAGDGKFHLKSMNGKYLVPASTLTTSTEQPTAAWTFEESATKGKDVIFNGDVPCQLHALKDGTLTNWGWNSSGTGARKDDDGCKFVFVEAAKMSDVLDNLYEFDTEDLGKVGYYTDATIDTYKSAVWAAMTPDQIDAAKTAVTSSTVWNMPVSGKAYTFKNVQKNGTKYWFKYNANATGNSIDLTTSEEEATPFVCRLLDNGKYVFVCNDGKYMICRGNYSTGIKDNYDADDAYTDIKIKKMTIGNNINGDQTTTRYITVWGRRNADNEGCVVVQNNMTFNATGYKYSSPADSVKAPFYNDSYSSAIIMEEAKAAFGNTPKVNDVNESDLLSEDLHNTYMATFSATYPTVSPEGVTAYYATKAGELICLNAIAKGEAIPANTGVILVSEEEGNAVMLPAAGENAADVTGNLMAHSAGADKNMTDVANAYLLTGGKQGVGFYRCSGGTLKANKAYLQLPVSLGANALRISFANAEDNEQGDTTDLESVTGNQQPTAVYDLQGRRVMTFGKGLYIVNGKKVIF